MAKIKSSQQSNLSKTGIDLASGFDFTKKEDKKAEASSLGLDSTKSKNTTNIGKTAAFKKETAATSTKSEKTAPKVTQTEKQITASHQAKKLQIPNEPVVEKNTKMSIVVSDLAKSNVEKYAKLYGYKKLSPFLNDLFENLDAYLGKD